METYALLFLIAFFGGFTQGLAGVGAILVTLPLMALLLDIKTVIPLAGLLALSINCMLIWQLRRHLQWDKCLPLLIATIPGIPVGVWILKVVRPEVLQLLLGFVITGFTLFSLAGKLPQRELKTRWAYVTGFVAGCLGGSIGASGPPIIVYTSIHPWHKDLIKVTMVAYFFFSCLGISSTHAANGLITLPILPLYASALPGMLLGGKLGAMSYGKISDTLYRRIIMYFLLVLGVLMVWKGRGLLLG